MNRRTLLALALLAGCDELVSNDAPAHDSCEVVVATLPVTASRPQYTGDSVDANDVDTFLDQARQVDLDACTELAFEEGLRWTARLLVDGRVGEAFEIPLGDTCAGRWQAPYEGSFVVEVEAEVGGVPQRGQVIVDVQDVWIAVLGDSYSSGEGVPEVPSDDPDALESVCEIWQWGDFEPAVWRDEQCHRSRWAWGNKVARRYQEEHPDVQVIVSFLACSGAEITSGMLLDYAGVVPGAPLPPQTQAVAEISQGTSNVSRDVRDPRATHVMSARRPDAVLMTAGGNDAGFSAFIEDCATFGCDWVELLEGSSERPDVLPELYGLLDDALQPSKPRRSAGYSTDGVFIPEYGDPTRNDLGLFDACGDLSTLLQTDADMGFAYHSMLVPINGHVRDAAEAYGWTLIDNVPEVTALHGICADESWVTNLSDSCNQQGDIKGTFHPNADGHQAYALQAYPSVAEWLAQRPSERPPLDVTVFTDDGSGTAFDGAEYLGDVTLTVTPTPPVGVEATLWVNGVEVGREATLPATDALLTEYEITVRSTFEGVGGEPLPLPDRTFTVGVKPTPGDFVGELVVEMTPINAKPAVAKPVALTSSDAWGVEWQAGTHVGAVTLAWSHPDPAVSVVARLRNRASLGGDGAPVTSPHRVDASAPNPGVTFGTDALQGFFLDVEATRDGVTGYGTVVVQVARSMDDLRAIVPTYTIHAPEDPTDFTRWDRQSSTTWARSGVHAGPWVGGFIIDVEAQLPGFIQSFGLRLDDGSGPIDIAPDMPFTYPGDYDATLFACLNDYQPCDATDSVSSFVVHDLQLAVD
jgi:hypothetical protein